MFPGCTPISGVAGMNCAAVAKVAYASKTTISVGAAYVLPRTSYGEWSFRTDYAYRSGRYFTALALPTAPYRDVLKGNAYGLLSARIALSDIRLGEDATAQLSIYGDNLTRKIYEISAFDLGFAGAATFSQPRTFGVDVKVNF